MKISSVFLIVLAVAAGMVVVRSYLRTRGGRFLLESNLPFWSSDHLSAKFGLVDCLVTGAVLVFGVDLLVERVRQWRVPRPWGVGRMTIAVTFLTLALDWIDRILPSPASILALLRGERLSKYALGILTEPDNWRYGLYPSFPLVLAAIWVCWRFSGRTRCEALDLQEGVGRLFGLSLFASAAAQYVILT